MKNLTKAILAFFISVLALLEALVYLIPLIIARVREHCPVRIQKLREAYQAGIALTNLAR